MSELRPRCCCSFFLIKLGLDVRVTSMNNPKPTILLIAYASVLIIISFSKSCHAFTIDLIHRDSNQSPFHNPSLSPSQLLSNAIRRSFQRAHRLNSHRHDPTAGLPKSDIFSINGEYLMRYSLGTPPVQTLGIVDTGSDIIWTQCQPCLKCFNQTLNIFSPNESSTYERIPCNASACSSLGTLSSCSKTRDNCLYSESFGDGSFTMGELSTDVVSLPSAKGKRVILAPNVMIGCGFANDGLFMAGESGIVGLGGGKLSLVRQLGPLAQGRFSYCLVSQTFNDSVVYSGKMSFGANASVVGKRAVSTRLVRKHPSTYYFLTLQGVRVGTEKYIDFYSANSKRTSREGNIVIDSGTTLTYLGKSAYTKVANAMRRSINLRLIRDPQEELDLCFFARKDSVGWFPKVVFHFEGADVELKRENLFVRTSNVSMCLAAMPTSSEEDDGVYGYLAQTNFLVGYDLEKRSVSFKPTDCGKF